MGFVWLVIAASLVLLRFSERKARRFRRRYLRNHSRLIPAIPSDYMLFESSVYLLVGEPQVRPLHVRRGTVFQTVPSRVYVIVDTELCWEHGGLATDVEAVSFSRRAA